MSYTLAFMCLYVVMICLAVSNGCFVLFYCLLWWRCGWDLDVGDCVGCLCVVVCVNVCGLTVWVS